MLTNKKAQTGFFVLIAFFAWGFVSAVAGFSQGTFVLLLFLVGCAVALGAAVSIQLEKLQDLRELERANTRMKLYLLSSYQFEAVVGRS